MNNHDLFLKEADEVIELLDIYICEDRYQLEEKLLEFINKKQAFIKELNKRKREER